MIAQSPSAQYQQEFASKLRHELEKLRMMLYIVKKREETKKQLVKCLVSILVFMIILHVQAENQKAAFMMHLEALSQVTDKNARPPIQDHNLCDDKSLVNKVKVENTKNGNKKKRKLRSAGVAHSHVSLTVCI